MDQLRLTTWISRCYELDSGSQEKLRAVIRERHDVRAVDGILPLYVSSGRLHSRLQWCLIEAVMEGVWRDSDELSDIGRLIKVRAPASRTR